MGRLRMKGGRAAAPTPLIPATQTINFYRLTRTGFDAQFMSYTGGGTLTIASQVNNVGSAVTMFRIGQNNSINWRGASATYSTAPPVATAGPYVVTVTDGTYTSVITIPILEGMGAREMTNVSKGGMWVTDAQYTTDEAANEWQGAFYLANNTRISKGDTIYVADGQVNPDGSLTCYHEPVATYPGTGRITITSRNPDPDPNGFNHGGKLARVYVAPATANVDVPIDWYKIQLYTNAPAYASGAFLMGKSGTFTGMTVTYCNVECGPAVANAATVDGLILGHNSTYTSGCTASHNRIRNTSSGITGSALTAQYNDISKININGIAYDGHNNLITHNHCWEFISYWPEHADAIQYNGLAGAVGDVGVVEKNTACYDLGNTDPGTSAGKTQPAQGYYMEDGEADGQSTNAGKMSNNICYITGLNAVFWHRIPNIIAQGNQALQDITRSPTFDARIYSGTGEAGGTCNYNCGNDCDFASQTGATVTPNKEIARTQAAYDIAFPNLYAALSGMRTRAQVLAASIPADLAIASGGCKETDGRFNSALFPDGSWNDFAPYVNGRLPAAA